MSAISRPEEVTIQYDDGDGECFVLDQHAYLNFAWSLKQVCG